MFIISKIKLLTSLVLIIHSLWLHLNFCLTGSQPFMRMGGKLWVLAQYSFHCTGVKYGSNPSYKLTTKIQARSSRIYAVRSILHYGSLSEGRRLCKMTLYRVIISSSSSSSNRNRYSNWNYE